MSMRERVFVPIALLAFFGVCVGLFPPKGSGEWASWAQALGSAFAIWGAFMVGAAQTRAAAQAVEVDRKHAKADTVSQAREVAEATAKVVLEEIARTREFVTVHASALISHPERLENCYPMIDSTLGLPMPGQCSKSLLEIRLAMGELIFVMREMSGTLVFGHSRVASVLDLTGIRCQIALKQIVDLDVEHQNAVYSTRTSHIS